ncbi:manganese transporter SMF2 [Kluyveromyces marxianus]|uniref:Manganese transporter SMF2 n=1 Tax=Kluyveromyces marxianus TaxID=4911 RepID=A0ABX6ET06_KLUMA|nr:manganese transporter SMF2 [Kluyveromyces marxianus]
MSSSVQYKKVPKSMDGVPSGGTSGGTNGSPNGNGPSGDGTSNGSPGYAWANPSEADAAGHIIDTRPQYIKTIQNSIRILKKYARFVGPGLMVSVSYMDPGNFSTAVAAGSAHRYKLLFSVLVTNILAAFWQCLCAKLGAVTGLDLAQNCRKHLPPNLNLLLYILAEVAIIATDLAEVVGTAISLNILFKVPLPLGVILTVIDVLVVLIAYRPNGSLKLVRWFEAFVSLLVFATVVCFAIELFSVHIESVGDVFKGFLPSKAVFEGDGLYLSLAILGATVMPHSLYLGSGVVQPRLRDYDIKEGNYHPSQNDEDNNHDNYKPSIDAIHDTLNYTVAELLVSLFTVALFVNCSILIVSGATLYGVTSNNAQEADLFTIYNLLSDTLSKTAGTIFVLALLFSGQSAGIVCTLSGQMVSEGFLNWTVAPALRRALTRVVAITPCLILVLVAGRNGLSGALNASQVVLSLLLPFVSAPLIYFTSNKHIMKVPLTIDCSQDSSNSFTLQDLSLNNVDSSSPAPTDSTLLPQETGDDEVDTNSRNNEVPLTNNNNEPIQYKDFSNSIPTTIIAVAVWLFISGLNFYLLISFSSGQDVHL